MVYDGTHWHYLIYVADPTKWGKALLLSLTLNSKK